MIIVKLSEILGRKKLKIANVIKDTGITRPTLTSLYYGNSTGINFETMDKLCRYLSVTPGELFRFIPLDIKSADISFDPTFTVNDDNDVTFHYSGSIRFSFPKITAINIKGYIDGSYLNIEMGVTKSVFNATFDSDSQDCIFDFLQDEILNELENYIEPPDITTLSIDFAPTEQTIATDSD